MKFLNFLKFLFTLLIIIFFKFNYSYSTINNKIVAKVGNEIVTSFELENKIRTILFLSNRQIDQVNINKVKKKAISDLINKKLKKEEIDRYGILIEENRVSSYLTDISSKLKMDKEDFIKIMKRNDISFDLYKEEIKIDLAWQSLIYELNKNSLSVDEKQIIQELNEIIKNKKDLEEYELAEIVVDKIYDSNQESILIEISDYISQFNFEEAALKYSISSSASEGGNIGWVSSSSLSNQLKNVLNKLSLGETSSPIINVDQIILIKLLNKRKTKANLNLEAEQIKNSLINKRKNELLNLYSNNHLSKKRNNTIIKFYNEK
jgi:peptidyl-prolyl cis-trans isomerase SurA